MMNYKIIDLQQGTPEWYAYRNNGVGASDMASIFLSEKQALRILSEKLGTKPKEVGSYTKSIFQSGHDWEAVVRQKINEDLDGEYFPAVVESMSNSSYFCSLDGLNSIVKTSIEIKSTKVEKKLSEVKSGLCPDEWYYQMQWQMFVTGFNYCTLYCVNSITGELYSLIVKRNEARISELKSCADSFIAKMRDGNNPEKIIENDTMKMLSAYKNKLAQIELEKIELEANIKALANLVLSEFNATKVSGCGVEIKTITRQGSVDYKKIPELKGVDLNKYRNKDIHYTQVVLKSDKALTLENKQEEGTTENE